MNEALVELDRFITVMVRLGWWREARTHEMTVGYQRGIRRLAPELPQAWVAEQVEVVAGRLEKGFHFRGKTPEIQAAGDARFFSLLRRYEVLVDIGRFQTMRRVYHLDPPPVPVQTSLLPEEVAV